MLGHFFGAGLVAQGVGVTKYVVLTGLYLRTQKTMAVTGPSQDGLLYPIASLTSLL